MSWHAPENFDFNRLQNADVYGANGEKIGSVDQVLTETTSGKHYLLVRTSPLGIGDEYYVPESDIDMLGQDRIVVNTTKDELQARGATRPPEERRRD